MRVAMCWAIVILAGSLSPQDVTLDAIVTPSTTILKDGKPVIFALHGYVEFRTLAEMFAYAKGSRELLRRGIESRVVSMFDERPLEVLITHTAAELRAALARVREPVPEGYGQAFLDVQQKWKHSLNCWSGSPSIAGRVLSNFYLINEGIELHGARYDSTEHFWQAVKYHPDTTVADLLDALRLLHEDRPIGDAPPEVAEFLRRNLAADRLEWFRAELGKHGIQPTDHPRLIQQRGQAPNRFTALEEKIFWGDLADLLHLTYAFALAGDPIRQELAKRHFDGIYLGSRKLGFISEEFRSMMFEIWKVKFLKIPRFREVVGSIPAEIRLEHFLNDADPPDIPIRRYVRDLNRIRELARQSTDRW